MTLRFTGTYEELRERLSLLSGVGEWLELNDNQKQFKSRNGGILNWFPSTGTVSFQGKAAVKQSLEASVTTALTTPLSSSFTSDTTEDAPVSSPQLGPEHIVPPQAPAVSPETPSFAAQQQENAYLGQRFADSELIIGLVGAVGTELKLVIDILEARLKVFGYHTNTVRVSRDIIPRVVPLIGQSLDEYERITCLMDAGDKARKETGDNSVLALGVAAHIASQRDKDHQGAKPRARSAYIVHSLKHPEEVARLREIYPEGFYLVGVHADQRRRTHFLTEHKRLSVQQAEALVVRDEDEHISYGQRTSDTFHLSDFFVRIDGNQDRLEKSTWRILDLLFGHPYCTPTFDEYAMFLAFAAALRSADLSRQVGAVVTHGCEVVATGANDCPKFGGGLYWPKYDSQSHEIKDEVDGRDYMRGEDANRVEQQKIIDDIIKRVNVADHIALKKALEESRIGDITEYGRMVHAEMEALMACARCRITTQGSSLYCTTFPCHNCAKHIIAAGVKRVIYVEPYPKSKAAEFHTDSISLGFQDNSETVQFEPFVGVGPRRFFDLFSMRLGSGYPLVRKDREGQILEWKQEGAKLRTQMLPCSYLELEIVASTIFNKFRQTQETL